MNLRKVLTLLVVSAGLVGVWSSPAFAACSFDKSNSHAIGSVTHGWDRFFCQPANNYLFNAYTNHGHGTKYVALWHDGTTHLHCDSLVSGSGNAACSATVTSVSHYTFHDIANIACNDRFNDGHGFDCHSMESLP